MTTDLTCALTGVAPTDDELAAAEEDVPVGWRRIVIEHRVPNPDAGVLREVMRQQEEALVGNAVQAAQAAGQVLTAEQMELIRNHARVITWAQYKQAVDAMPEYLSQVEQVIIAPFDRTADGPEAKAEFNRLRGVLGLSPIE